MLSKEGRSRRSGEARSGLYLVARLRGFDQGIVRPDGATHVLHRTFENRRYSAIEAIHFPRKFGG
jgi:hypothetical protein